MRFGSDRIGRLQALARAGVALGTSSWKYPGWLGQLYDEQRYLTRGRFSGPRFERECLAEYAAVFASVCVDASYYRFPDSDGLDRLAGQVPDGFRFAYKVTDTITVKNFPHHARHGRHAGQANPHFLDRGLFLESFLKPMERHRDRTGLIIFEFSRFHRRDFQHGREFLAALDRFLAGLPTREWDFAVELRNESLLRPQYFELLDRHGVGHVYNHWQQMPGAEAQLDLRSPSTLAGPCGMRLLLKPGRAYQEAVDTFQPYDRIHEERPEARQAAVRFIRAQLATPGRRRGAVYVNNRLEGNALETIAAILDLLAHDA
jgi:uncharacterized protein YecE (DUF72 family)